MGISEIIGGTKGPFRTMASFLTKNKRNVSCKIIPNDEISICV